jgi:hypothetical protein
MVVDGCFHVGAPWTVTATGASTASVVSTTDHGKALKLHGSPVSGDFLTALRGLSSSTSEINVQVDINPNSGASFIWSLQGAGDTLGARRIRLQRAPNSTTLVASTSPSGNTNCGTVASGVWSTVTLIVHTPTCSGHTFDVRINGAATACTGIATGIDVPFNGVSVMDASNDGWGGDVLFDNILVTTP